MAEITALDVKCPFCGAEPGNGCVDPKTGQDYPSHRGRNVLAMNIQDAPALRSANLLARRDRIANAVASVQVRVRTAREAVPAENVASVHGITDEPPIALTVACPNCGAVIGQACSTPSGLCRIRKQLALGHGADV